MKIPVFNKIDDHLPQMVRFATWRPVAVITEDSLNVVLSFLVMAQKRSITRDGCA